MSTTAKQVMDIRTSKGPGDSSNEQLRNWTDRGWDQAMKEGNYDRSREHLNFEIQNGRIIPIQKNRSLPDRMAENLEARGIKDPNAGLETPKYRTVVNFIFGGSTDRMRELAFGTQKVDFDSKSGNSHIKRMPEIEDWARDIYDFVAGKWGEENILSFIVHLDEKNPHIHCSLLPIDKNNKFAYKKMFAGKDIIEFKKKSLALHDELAKVNEKWGLSRGTSITESGAKHRSTEDYRRWLAEECDSLEKQKANTERALHDLSVELAIAEKRHKGLTTMVENARKEIADLEKQLAPLRELQRNSQAVSAEIAQKIQSLENQKAVAEEKLADKLAKLDNANQLLDRLRQDKDEIERMADEMEQKANDSELSWAHNMSYHLNSVLVDTMASEFMTRYPKLPDNIKLSFDGTLLEELAEDGNHVVQVALSLICGYVDDATTIAKTHGGGGGGSKSGWGRDPKDDDREWARRCLARARAMCAPANGRRRKK